MSVLPPNKPKETIEVPRNFFIWGPTMNGKSYLASEFPNAIILNTDGNAKQIATPSIDLKNERNPDGSIKKNVVVQVVEILKALESGKHTYETVVVDVVDDLVTLIEQAICEENGVDYIGDVPYGKGWGLRKTFITSIVVRLKALPMNVIYISRYATKLDGTVEVPIPSLSDKDLNVVNGNCDLNILCQKIGKKYLRRVVDRRKEYKREWVKDDRILAILDTITGAFPKDTSGPKKPTTDAAPVEEKPSLESLAEEIAPPELEDKAPGVSETASGVSTESDEPPFLDEDDIAKETLYYQHEGSGEYIIVEKGESLEFLSKDIYDPRTKEDYEKWKAESEGIKQYVKDNPPPATPKEDKPKPKAPRTVAPRAPRAPRTK